MDPDVISVLTVKFIEHNCINQLLALRATCRDAGLLITSGLVFYHRQHPVMPRRCFIPIRECMSCLKQGEMRAYRRYDETFAVFCPDSVMCRIGVLINATARQLVREGKFFMQPVPEWSRVGPFNVIRSSGAIDPGWLLWKGEWSWDEERQDIQLNCIQQFDPIRDGKQLTRWCWLSDLEKANENFTLPAGNLACHTCYSLGQSQVKMEAAIMARIPGVLTPTFSLPREFEHVYTPD